MVYSNINVDIVHGFVKDFIHHARDDTNCKVVFLNKSELDLMFKGLLKGEITRGTYFNVIIRKTTSYDLKYFFSLNRVQC